MVELTLNRSPVTQASRCCAITADILVLVLTWLKTWETYNASRLHLMAPRLGALFLRDGELRLSQCYKSSSDCTLHRHYIFRVSEESHQRLRLHDSRLTQYPPRTQHPPTYLQYDFVQRGAHRCL